LLHRKNRVYKQGANVIQVYTLTYYISQVTAEYTTASKTETDTTCVQNKTHGLRM